jgi:cyclopropane-fatty-acyl-phospholipid synthase
MVGVPARRSAARATALEAWLARSLLRVAGDPPIAVALWDGTEVRGRGEPVAAMIVRDRRTLWRVIANPDLHFGDAYATGQIEIQGDLVQFLETVYRGCPPDGQPVGWLPKLLARCRGPRANTLLGSRSNIHHHYDLGDDFYRLWLDREMVYTCAYFPAPRVTLEEAQAAKMDLVCRKLWLRPGEAVVEAGCGWGGLALFMARNYGVTVKAYNVSRAQIEFARRRAREEGLEARVEFIEDDYRKIAGRFDAFVSVGMLEHVGRKHYRELANVIDRCLSPNGRGLLHTIGRDVPGPLNSWIERRIFPGAYPPCLREIMDVLEPRAFSVLDVENLRLHYAETLRHWLSRYEGAAGRVAGMFDESFVRAWRLYLAGSMVAFTTGALQLFQVVFARHAMNQIPWTRQQLFAGSRPGPDNNSDGRPSWTAST